MALGRQMRITQQSGKGPVDALVNTGQVHFRDGEFVHCLVILVGTAHAVLLERFLALQLFGEIGNALDGFPLLQHRRAVRRLERLHFGTHHVHLRQRLTLRHFVACVF